MKRPLINSGNYLSIGEDLFAVSLLTQHAYQAPQLNRCTTTTPSLNVPIIRLGDRHLFAKAGICIIHVSNIMDCCMSTSFLEWNNWSVNDRPLVRNCSKENLRAVFDVITHVQVWYECFKVTQLERTRWKRSHAKNVEFAFKF